MAKLFGSPAAFKAALESHLRRRASASGVPFSTLQLKFAIERLLARLFHKDEAGWLLKGGYSLDLRFRPKSRTTKDVDLTVERPAPIVAIFERLLAASGVDLGDFLTYRIGTPKKELTNAPGGGGRFPCEALLLGKVYARFPIDVGLGDLAFGEPDVLFGEDSLAFAGLDAARVRAISLAQQFAEKAHAYTFPWGDRPNTRSKDLVDLVLIVERGELDPISVCRAVAATFACRATHSVPGDLAPPPPAWDREFTSMAEEAGLRTSDSLQGFEEIRQFWLRHRLG